MNGLFNWLAQVTTVTGLNLRTIRLRLASSAVAVIGIAGVVAVFVAVLSMAEGFRRTMATTGSPDTAIVMRTGSSSEMVSILSPEDARIVGDAPGVLRSGAGAVVSTESFVMIDLPKQSSGTPANVALRGVGPRAFDVRRSVKMTSGRMFTTGTNEVIAGRAAVGQFRGLEVGQTVRVGQNAWKIVGIFDTGGTVADSEVWCDMTVLGPAYRRGNSFQTVYVKLQSADAFERFSDALSTDPRTSLKVQRETEYYAEQSQSVYTLITTLGTMIAALMGIGAVFGAINTMYSAVASRTREIATLRALGFGSTPVVVSVLVESLALALIGGALGGGLAYVAFNGFETSTINFQTFSQIGFAFAVTPGLISSGIVYALVMGCVGGFLPAIRAARLPIVSALREL